MLDGPMWFLEIPGCPVNVWVDVWVEIGVVWVDKAVWVESLDVFL